MTARTRGWYEPVPALLAATPPEVVLCHDISDWTRCPPTPRAASRCSATLDVVDQDLRQRQETGKGRRILLLGTGDPHIVDYLALAKEVFPTFDDEVEAESPPAGEVRANRLRLEFSPR
ncbi:hypothetical protein [Sphaerisporangium fuscum]|uniref:hypothetical protein n=1 Tax=Sphaerisporangium fuscum TaxID=2835868 RepID=UPI001BDCDE62|nr:hypothetical protein [Sphaerisporangium fuscum]